MPSHLDQMRELPHSSGDISCQGDTALPVAVSDDLYDVVERYVNPAGLIDVPHVLYRLIARYLDAFDIANSDLTAHQLWLTRHCPDFWEKIFKIHFAPTHYFHALPVRPDPKNRSAMVAYANTCVALFRVCYQRDYAYLSLPQCQYVMAFKTGNLEALKTGYGIAEMGKSNLLRFNPFKGEIPKVCNLLAYHKGVNNLLDWARRNGHKKLLAVCFQAMLPPETAWVDLSVKAICQIDKWKCTPLHWAILCSQEKPALSMIEKLSEAKICVNLPVHDATTPYDLNKQDTVTALHLAAHVGSVKLIKALYGYGVDMNVVDSGYENTFSTALLWAAANGHEAAFEALLACGASLQLQSEIGNIFHFFAGHQATYDVGKVVALLLKYIDQESHLTLLNQTDQHGYTPLMNACLDNNMAFIVSLLNQKKGIEITTTVRSGNLLHMLVSNESWNRTEGTVVPTLKWLLNRDNVRKQLLNAQNAIMGDTPLLSACQSEKCTSVVATLLDASGINLSIKNKFGKNAFHLVVDREARAYYNGEEAYSDEEKVPQCSLLLRYVKSNLSTRAITTLLHAKDGRSNTPLMLACQVYLSSFLVAGREKSIIIIQKLLSVMDLSQVDVDDGQNSLHHAALDGVRHIKILCEYAEAPSALTTLITCFDKKDNHGKTPLDLAKAQHTTVVESIIDPILRRLDRTDTGDSVLHKAVKMGSVDCLLKVMQHISHTGSADLITLFSQKNDHGRTPLQTAYYYGHSAVAAVLVSAFYQQWQQCQWDREHAGVRSVQLLWDCIKKEGVRGKSVASSLHKDSKKMYDFLSKLDDMAKKREALSVDGRTEAIEALDTLLLDMHSFTARLFEKISHSPQERPIHLQEWKEDCLQAIKQAQSSALSHHEGWACVLKNIALAVLTVGVGYAIACLVNRALTGRAVFFSEDTHSTAQLHALSESMEIPCTQRG